MLIMKHFQMERYHPEGNQSVRSKSQRTTMPLSVQRKQLLIINDKICKSRFLRLPMLPNSRSSCLVGRSSLGSSAAVAVANPIKAAASLVPFTCMESPSSAACLENKASLSPHPPQGTSSQSSSSAGRCTHRLLHAQGEGRTIPAALTRSAACICCTACCIARRR